MNKDFNFLISMNLPLFPQLREGLEDKEEEKGLIVAMILNLGRRV